MGRAGLGGALWRSAAEVGAGDAVPGEGGERDVDRVSRPGEAERLLEMAFDAGSGAVGGEVDGPEVDVWVGRLEVVFGVGTVVLGRGCLNFAGPVGEAGGEV